MPVERPTPHLSLELLRASGTPSPVDLLKHSKQAGDIRRWAEEACLLLSTLVIDSLQCILCSLLKRAHLIIILGLLTALLSGCATVRIETNNELVRIERHWGVLTLEIVEPKKIQVVEVIAFGMIRSPFGWSAGYSHQTWAALGPECRLVLWVSDPEQIEIAKQLAFSTNRTCAITHSTTSTEGPTNAK